MPPTPLTEAERRERTAGQGTGPARDGHSAEIPRAPARRSPLQLVGHPAAVVGLIVVLGALLSWRHTRHVHEWIVMTDELQYLKLGQSFGDGSFPVPTLRGEHIELLSVLYPLLIAPVLALFSAPDGYQVLHLLNALLVASTAVPVYLLARAVGAGRRPSYLAAALAVAIPWAATSAVVMTESAAYPAFAWALLGVQRALVVPSPGRDLVALVGIGVAFFARTQFVFLAPAFPALVALHETLFALVGGRRTASRATRLRLLRDRLRPHAALGALTALGLVLVVLPATPLTSLLGPFRGTVAEGGVLPHGLGHAMRTQLTLVAGGLGIVPLALGAGWAMASLLRPADRPSHAFATLTVVVGVGLTYVVAVFGLRHAPGPLDRYLFYLAPLLIVASVACLAQGRARPLGLAAGALLTFYVVRSSGVTFIEPAGLFVNSQASEFHRVLHGQVYRIATTLGISGLSPVALFSWGTLVVAAAVSLLIHRAERLVLAIVGLPLLALAIVQDDYVSKRVTFGINTGQGAINAGSLSGRDWIDRALPAGGDVALSPSPLGEPFLTQRVWWNAEFWNKRVNRAVIYDRFGDNTPFPYRSMSVDGRDGAIRTSDGSEPRFMVFARNQIDFRPRGHLLAEYRTTIPQDPGLELLDLDLPYRASWIADGAADDGWIVRGKPARVRVFPRADGRPQRLTVNLDLPVGRVAASPFVVRAGRRVARGRAAAGTVDGDAEATLCVAAAVREASISTRAVRPLPDGRRVGVHLRRIRVEPGGRGC
jgi:Dolichyl-phosphate-mannose-protein mannosyltransferase